LKSVYFSISYSKYKNGAFFETHTPLFRHKGSTTASYNHTKQVQIKKTTKIYTQSTIKNTTKTYNKIILPESASVHKVLPHTVFYLLQTMVC